MRATALFVGGTSSNAGKSWMVTAICAWLRQQGVSVAPFKAQNMSNNSYPCRAGGEIGRAQVAQAEACGLEPEPAMNPILLKPTGNGTSQVVVNGRMWKTLPARGYYAYADEMRAHVRAAYEDLASRFEAIIIEGAGSVSELNLREYDLVNLDLVRRVGAPWLLVADIERGGVFASVIGTVDLLSPEERGLFRGFAINKFRGDPSLFEDGVRMLEERTRAHCFGVFPYASDLRLDPEDSLALNTRPGQIAPAGARLAIVQFPCLSNSTDFRLLTWAHWITMPPAGDYDFIMLPGSKNTIEDLAWLRDTGLANWMISQHGRGATVIGICGGYQMLGRSITDPKGIESQHGGGVGLGLLPVDTRLTSEKTTRVVTAVTRGGARCGAYEIHVGVTAVDAGSGLVPFARLDDGRVDGACARGVIGTYLHGAFEHPDVCTEVFGVPMREVASKSSQYEQMGQWFGRYGRGLERLGLHCRN